MISLLSPRPLPRAPRVTRKLLLLCLLNLVLLIWLDLAYCISGEIQNRGFQKILTKGLCLCRVPLLTLSCFCMFFRLSLWGYSSKCIWKGRDFCTLSSPELLSSQLTPTEALQLRTEPHPDLSTMHLPTSCDPRVCVGS